MMQLVALHFSNFSTSSHAQGRWSDPAPWATCEFCLSLAAYGNKKEKTVQSVRGVRPPPLLAKPCKKKCFQKVLFHMVGLFVCLLACLLVCLLSQREGSDHLSCWPCHAMPCHVNMLFILLLYQSYPKYIYIYHFMLFPLVASIQIPAIPSQPFPSQFFLPHDTNLVALHTLAWSHLVTNPCPSSSHCPSVGTLPHTGLEPTTN